LFSAAWCGSGSVFLEIGERDNLRVREVKASSRGEHPCPPLNLEIE
jgi:hypothetical protein